ncbi:hypothetical protein EV182_000604 [Spiromyces aspiralis]|uniref:Uncharacterized protein n=1 Tax=Spiromyces aspiralis TaxID=68401 RepID=A0ACC1I1W4_9FUNG|nr:hypothetical protein EV182_000604 [Spiromyces aspiralis]
MQTGERVELLVLGKGFVGQYVTQYCREMNISCAATTRDGRDGTIQWCLPESPSPSSSLSSAGGVDAGLPQARAVLLTFPIRQVETMDWLVTAYNSRCDSNVRWIYLGSTRAFTRVPSTRRTAPNFEMDPQRLASEERMMKIHNGVVLKEPKHWPRFYKTTESMLCKIRDPTLHLIHGMDVARAVVDCLLTRSEGGQRWLLSDGKVYDMLRIIARYPTDQTRQLLASAAEADPDAVLGAFGTLDIDWILTYGSDPTARQAKLTRRIDPDDFFLEFGFTPAHYYNYT